VAEVVWKIRLLEERRPNSRNSSDLEVLAMGILESLQGMPKIVYSMVVEKQVLKPSRKAEENPGMGRASNSD